MSSRATSGGFMARGGVWVLAQFILMLGAIVLGLVYPGSWSGATILLLGLPPITLGAVFGVGGVVALGRNRTAYPRPLTEGELVRDGIYSRVRHPLYTSVVLISLGWAGLWWSWPALLAATALIPLLAAKARREEAWLREKFPDYAGYARRVPAFLPRLGRQPPAV